MDIRCIVTGQSESGKSVLMRDTPFKPVTLALFPGYEFHRLWGSDSVPELPSDGSRRRTLAISPQYRVSASASSPYRRTRPRRIDRLNTASALEEIQQKLPGMLDVLERDHPGMHTTDTVDFDVVVSGEVVLELDDRAEVLLKAGDCVIQNGTRHAWHNRSSANCSSPSRY